MSNTPHPPSRRRASRWLAVPTALAIGVGTTTLLPSQAEAAPQKSPDVAKLAGKQLSKQKITWQTCDFGEKRLNDRFAGRANVKCATIKVPRDWHNPTNGKTWDIRISQTFNIAPSDPRSKGAILINPGGPGGSGLVWGAAMADLAADLRPYYNFVGMDPRGIGQSSKVSCNYTFDAASTDPLVETKAIGAQCSNNPDVKTITTEQTAYDMDFIRHLLGQKKLSYIGYSYGTWLGSWYSKVFSDKAGMMLLDSATDVTLPTLQRTWEMQPISRDRQFEMHMMNWIARQDATYKLGTDPVKIRARYVAATKDRDPLSVLMVWYMSGGLGAFSNNSQYPVAADVVKALIVAGEKPAPASTARTAAQDPVDTAQQLLGELVTQSRSAQARSQAAAGQQKLTALAAVPDAAPKPTTKTFSEPFEMIRCGDGQWTQGERYWKAREAKLAGKAPLSASWGAFEVPVCAFWATNNLMPVAQAKTYPKTIVVQTELDSQTAWETGYASAMKLPNTSAIFVDNEGSHGAFAYGTECVDRPIVRFFLQGKLPKNVSVCQALPLPKETTTFESWAKLNAVGKHVPVPAGPNVPAATARQTLTKNLLVAEASKAEYTSELRQQIQRRYGDAGVAAATKAGVFR